MISIIDRLLESLLKASKIFPLELDNHTKELIASILWAVIGCASIGLPLAPINSYALTLLIGFVLAGGAAALYVENALPSLSLLKKRYVIPIEIIGLSFLLSFALFHTVSYFLIGFAFCVFLPILYLIFLGASFEQIFKPISKGLLAAFWIMVIVSFLSGPVYTGDQFAVFLKNPNHFGNVLIAATTCTGFLFVNSLVNEQKTCYFYGSSLAVIITLVFMSVSRTAILAAVAQLVAIVCISLYVVAHREYGKVAARLIKTIGLAAIVALMAGALTVGAFTVAKTAIADALPGLQIPEWFYAEDMDGELGEASDILEENAARFGKGLESGDGNAFTSGRLGIWQAYIENISFVGHESESMALSSGARVYASINAHNVYLQLAYSAGLAAGVSIAALMLIAIFDALCLFISLSKGTRKLLPPSVVTLYCCAVAGFFLYSLVADGYMMFKYLPATMFWLGLSVATVRMKSCNQEGSDSI